MRIKILQKLGICKEQEYYTLEEIQDLMGVKGPSIAAPKIFWLDKY